jgi:hypothetical protein
MKKLISSLVSMVLLISAFSSLSALAYTSTNIPLDGTVVTSDLSTDIQIFNINVPYRNGVTDVTFWIDGLPEGYDVLFEGDTSSTVHPAQPYETIFTEASLTGGTYELWVRSPDDETYQPEPGAQYSIHVDDIMYHASNDESNPTQLTEGVSYKSNLYDGRTTDYYTFTITEDRNVHVSVNPVPISHHYQLEISGNGMYPYTVDSAGDFLDMYVDYLDAGQYYLKLKSDWRVRTEPFETWYGITYTTSEITE